ncbi:fibronectin type III domain-containing protein [Corynebacterium uterequi]|uniref:Calcineurin-like phosphoesterase n=1 Tax=Corynebacterium uterequi TaxID=1072256 RepID=A0A0G3HID1_9CORY|nr:fibronectin type III domain-containing protein [Corynebacterium uterequi]AKK11643.1 Calcineurin-like phosphoesterase [Corynebacterium uterequi]
MTSSTPSRKKLLTAVLALGLIGSTCPPAFAMGGAPAPGPAPAANIPVMPDAPATPEAATTITVGIGASESQANFNWTTQDTNPSYLQIAPTTQGLDSDATFTVPSRSAYVLVVPAGNYAHTAEVGGLAENTDYVYRVGSDASGWSTPETFTTGTYGDEWNFIAFGDPQIGASGDARADGAGWRQTLDTALAQAPDASFILSLGDQVNYPDFYVEFEEFFSPEQLDNHRLAVLNGNHEVLGLSGAHARMFNEPNTAADSLTDSHHYFFEYNNALFVVLDTNFDSDADIATQKAFLRNTIAEYGQDKDWRIVSYHHSTFSQAYHQTDNVVQRYREEMTEELSANGVDLVLSGHDHIHTRSHLMEGSTPIEPDTETRPGDVLYPKPGQVLYYTANSASGSKFYPMAVAEGSDYVEHEDITTMEQSDASGLTAESTAYWVQDETPDYTTIDVTEDELTIVTRNTQDNSLVDHVTLRKADPASYPDSEAAESGEVTKDSES